MTAPGRELGSCETPLAEAYDAALLDLDGVVYRGTTAIEHAAASLRAAEAGGMRLTYVTNNASRTPEQVVEVLRSVDVAASPAEVATSAQAAARLLSARFPAGSRILLIGAEGLRRAVTDAGLTPVDSAADQPVAVVQGFSDATTYAMLAEAALAVAAGALWVATNLDATIPTARGLLPGNGALVAAVAHATGVVPLAAGKPQRPLHDEAVLRTGAVHPLVVGDRLDTDIDGALAVGVDSLLVLTGVTTLAELVRVPAGRRPTYVGADLRALLGPHSAIVADGKAVSCGGARASFAGGKVTVVAAEASTTDALRAACAVGWLAHDAGGTVDHFDGIAMT